MDGSRTVSVVAGLAMVWTLAAPGRAASEIGGYLEMGIGQCAARPLEKPTSLAIMFSGGASPRSARSLAPAVQGSLSLGGDLVGTSLHIPEASRPGERRQWTLLPGLEWRPSGSDGRFHSFLGVGLGHASLKDARGRFEPPFGANWIIPHRELTAMALGASISVRAEEGISGYAMRLGARYHALVHQGAQPASAWAATVGVER